MVVQEYAIVTDPVRGGFGPDGTYYLGRDNTGSGGGNGDALKVLAVKDCGWPVVELGNSPITDPDVAVVDSAGVLSGTPNTVLVGVNLSAASGKISGIRPIGTVFDVMPPNGNLRNPNIMRFESAASLIVVDSQLNRVVRTNIATVTPLFSRSGVTGMVVAPNGDIYTAANTGVIQINSSTGALLNSNLASLGSSPNGVSIALGPGFGPFGSDLYAIRNGLLYQITSVGGVTQIGSGFQQLCYDLAFGPDGMLYVASFSTDRVLRITTPGTTTVGGQIQFNDYFGPAPTQVDVEVRWAGTQALVGNFTVNVDGSGVMDTITVPENGCYMMAIKERKWLRKALVADARTMPSNAVFSLVNGDINEDNVIDLLDYDIFSEYFDRSSGDSDWTTPGSSGFAPQDADIDGDEFVSLLDYDTFSKNFDQIGD